MINPVERRTIDFTTDRFSDQPRFLRTKVYTPDECATFAAAHPERLVAPPEPPKPERTPDPANPLRYAKAPAPKPAPKPKPAPRKPKPATPSRRTRTSLRVPSLTVEAIVERQRRGLTLMEIAKEFDCAQSLVSQRMDRARRKGQLAPSQELGICKCGNPKFPSSGACSECNRKVKRAAGRSRERKSNGRK
jgi:transposase-like protein